MARRDDEGPPGQTSKSDSGTADEEFVFATHVPAAGVAVIDALSAELIALEQVIACLRSLEALLESGDERLLPATARNLKAAIVAVEEAEDRRDLALSELAVTSGSDALDDLPEDLVGGLRQNRAAGLKLRTEVAGLATSCRRHAEVVLQLIRQRCAVLEGGGDADETPVAEIERGEEIVELRLRELTYSGLHGLLHSISRAPR